MMGRKTITQADMSTKQVQELVGTMENSVQAVKVAYRTIPKLYQKNSAPFNSFYFP